MWFIYFAIYWTIGNLVVDWMYSNEEDEITMVTYGCLVLIWPGILFAYTFITFLTFILECVDSIFGRR